MSEGPRGDKLSLSPLIGRGGSGLNVFLRSPDRRSQDSRRAPVWLGWLSGDTPGRDRMD